MQFVYKYKKFLSYVIKKVGLAIAPLNLKLLSNILSKKNHKQLIGYLRDVNFFKKYLSEFSKIALPLTKLTKILINFTWNKEADLPYINLKHLFIKAPILKTTKSKNNFVVECNSKNFSIRVVIKQETDQYYILFLISKNITSSWNKIPCLW